MKLYFVYKTFFDEEYDFLADEKNSLEKLIRDDLQLIVKIDESKLKNIKTLEELDNFALDIIDNAIRKSDSTFYKHRNIFNRDRRTMFYNDNYKSAMFDSTYQYCLDDNWKLNFVFKFDDDSYYDISTTENNISIEEAKKIKIHNIHCELYYNGELEY